MTWYERYDTALFLPVLAVCLALTLGKMVPGTMLSAILLGAGVVLFGLPHGSLDVLVARHVFRLKNLTTIALFLIGYMGLAAFYALIWWRSPPVALAAFLILSAVHFSSDWEDRGALITRLAYGFAVVTLPVIGHAQAVHGIYGMLGVGAPEYLLLAAKLVALPACLLALVGVSRPAHTRTRDLVEFLGILVGGIVLPPILYFLCYFCFLHSPRHLLATAKEERLTNLRQIARETAAPTLAVSAVALLFLTVPALAITSSRLVQVIFIGLAALTVPHMLLTAVAHHRRNAGASFGLEPALK